ncbi:MAG: DUF4349 domain-containing protein [Roseburia inulinivorans]
MSAGRKLIRTVYLSLQTTEFDSVLSNLSEKTAELGGYIENSSVSGIVIIITIPDMQVIR